VDAPKHSIDFVGIDKNSFDVVGLNERGAFVAEDLHEGATAFVQKRPRVSPRR
jgi:hypothetical protein